MPVRRLRQDEAPRADRQGGEGADEHGDHHRDGQDHPQDQPDAARTPRRLRRGGQRGCRMRPSTQPVQPLVRTCAQSPRRCTSTASRPGASWATTWASAGLRPATRPAGARGGSATNPMPRPAPVRQAEAPASVPERGRQPRPTVSAARAAGGLRVGRGLRRCELCGATARHRLLLQPRLRPRDLEHGNGEALPRDAFEPDDVADLHAALDGLTHRFSPRTPAGCTPRPSAITQTSPCRLRGPELSWRTAASSAGGPRIVTSSAVEFRTMTVVLAADVEADHPNARPSAGASTPDQDSSFRDELPVARNISCLVRRPSMEKRYGHRHPFVRPGRLDGRPRGPTRCS